MSQTELAKVLNTSQPTINRWESSTKTRPTITTLKKIAAVFDVGLEVRFVPFSKLMKFVSSTPYVESGINTESFYVASFANDRDLYSTDTNENEIGQGKKPPQRDFGSGDPFDNEMSGQNPQMGELNG